MFQDIQDIPSIKADRNFIDINSRFDACGVRTWSTVDERALLFGLASRDDVSTVVEIGSFCGGSAAFLAEAMRLKGKSKSVFCVDPFMGAPVWFPRGYMHSTYDEFSRNMNTLALSDQIVPMRGESSSVASIWPAKPIDLVFIDGDHSLLGIISDFEKWVPKVKSGGFILIDDVDHIQEVAKFNDILASMKGIKKIAHIGGISVFQRTHSESSFAQDFLVKLDSMNIRRPWNYAGLADGRNPASFVKRAWPVNENSLSYELAFFSVCPIGDYGVTKNISPQLKKVAQCVSDDKKDGKCVDISPNERSALRVCFCTIVEIATLSGCMQPGTVVLAEVDNVAAHIEPARKIFSTAGLEGFGYEQDGSIFWGVFHPQILSPDAIVASHFRNAGLN